MVSAPVPVKKQSWLSKFGQDILKVLGIAQKVEQVAEPVVEALVPASIPFFGIFDKIIQVVMLGEATFAAVGQQSNGAAKLAAALPGVKAMLDQWVMDNLPGSQQILASEAYVSAKAANATAYINAAVAFLNSLPPAATTAVTAPAVAAASAAKAAMQGVTVTVS